jgi:arylsulfatase A-like enzyme
LKVNAVVNWINGQNHLGTASAPVPAIFGMNFQAVSVGQKTAGYADAAGTPTAALASSLDFVDASLGQFVAELGRQGLFESTAIVVSAKHGQSPINPALRRIVDANLLTTVVNAVAPDLMAQATADDIALLWLNDRSKAPAVAGALTTHASELGIASTLTWAGLLPFAEDPRTDSRVPDVIGISVGGVIYAGPTATKLAEHGGFKEEDTHVPLLVVLPQGAGDDGGANGDSRVLTEPVRTAQIAPTILTLLGLDPDALQAVRLEGTRPLPLGKSE